ncbi:MAG: calpastatin [Alphaproteobacteria bacterium MedPE-SWcel]|nr:MAG: calpastatin [Alphaproteobacteria bacterium MedPE-SWcel]
MTYDDDPFEDDLGEELDMFVEAQDAVWPDVLSELKAGKKTSHWMWFVFPQLASLGQSPMSQLYGLEDLREAELYLGHDVLRARLIEVCDLVLTHKGRAADAILGRVDAKKLRSSMTLFAAAPNAPSQCASVLAAFFDSIPCEATMQNVAPV